MTEMTRNDIAAFTLFKKMMARLAENREEYTARLAVHQHAYAIFNQLNGIVSASGVSHPTTFTFMPGHTHSVSPMIPEWTPYMLPSEYEVFDAYMRGEDVILHLLAEER
jgi:hypothetical protein